MWALSTPVCHHKIRVPEYDEIEFKKSNTLRLSLILFVIFFFIFLPDLDVRYSHMICFCQCYKQKRDYIITSCEKL